MIRRWKILNRIFSKKGSMNQQSRRHFLKVSATSVAAVASAEVAAQPAAQLSPKTIAEVNAVEARDLIASTADWNDGLAHPIPFQPQLGKGKEKALVLGGGGVVLISWYLGYFHALKKHGIDVSDADMIVGTSAGSMIGAMLAKGNLWRMAGEMDFFAYFPKIFAELVPEVQFNASQLRAKALAYNAKDAAPQTIQAVGHAAMAAHNPSGQDKYKKTVAKVIGLTDWPSKSFYASANDCYTGERLIISASSNVPIVDACSASSSLPGGSGPTFVQNRLCMDGGICQSSTHSDVVAGVKRAFVISLADGGPNELKENLRTSGFPDSLLQELNNLRDQGTKVLHIVAGLPPGMTRIDSVMDANLITPFMKYGFERGTADASKVKAFWG